MGLTITQLTRKTSKYKCEYCKFKSNSVIVYKDHQKRHRIFVRNGNRNI